MYRERERGRGCWCWCWCWGRWWCWGSCGGGCGGCPSAASAAAGVARKGGSMWKKGNKPREHRGWEGDGETNVIHRKRKTKLYMTK